MSEFIMQSWILDLGWMVAKIMVVIGVMLFVGIFFAFICKTSKYNTVKSKMEFEIKLHYSHSYFFARKMVGFYLWFRNNSVGPEGNSTRGLLLKASS